MAKCPSCKSAVTSLKHEQVKSRWTTQQVNCVAFVCPKCDTIISVQVDPLIVARYTADVTKKKVKD